MIKPLKHFDSPAGCRHTSNTCVGHPAHRVQPLQAAQAPFGSSEEAGLGPRQMGVGGAGEPQVRMEPFKRLRRRRVLAARSLSIQRGSKLLRGLEAAAKRAMQVRPEIFRDMVDRAIRGVEEDVTVHAFLWLDESDLVECLEHREPTTRSRARPDRGDPFSGWPLVGREHLLEKP